MSTRKWQRFLYPKEKPLIIIVAVGVISNSATQKIRLEADELIAVLIPENLSGSGEFYSDFSQVSDDEVIQYLHKLKTLKATG